MAVPKRELYKEERGRSCREAGNDGPVPAGGDVPKQVDLPLLRYQLRSPRQSNPILRLFCGLFAY